MRKIVWSALVMALVPAAVVAQVVTPAAVQQSRPFEPALDVAVTAAAVDATSSPAAEQAPAAQDPSAKQDSATMDFFRKIEISGFVDTYYTYNFNRPSQPCATVGGVAVSNCLYNFNVAHNSLSLNLAEVALEKKPTSDSRVGFRLDLDYGPTATLVHAFEPGGETTFQNIEQAYVSFLAPAGKGLQLDFGKFVTWNGQEVIETKDNWNYSRGLLFAWAIPYYHTGLRAAYAVNDKVSVTGYLVNGWNNAVDNNTGKTIGGQVIYKPTGSLAIIENYTGGPEQTDDNDDWRHLSDTIVTYTVNKQVSVAANYDYAQDKVAGATVKWQGIAGYLRYQANDWFALSPRFEYFNDEDGFETGAVQKVKEATVTAEFKHKDGIIMRLEYRGDFSNTPFFTKKVAEAVKSQNTFTVGVIYAFSTKAQ
jgi:Putative beta-barrel porin-2, OmpL-like. bbp2